MFKPDHLKTDYVTMVSLNIRGIQLGGGQINIRLKPLFDYVEQKSVSELHLQEVFLYTVLDEISKNIPRLIHVVYERGRFGPKAGLVSFFQKEPKKISFHALSPARLASFDVFGLIPFIHKGVLLSQFSDGQIRFNIHLSPNHSGDWNTKSVHTDLIERQLDEVSVIFSRFISQAWITNAVILGDFNLPQTTDTFTGFVNRLHLIDAFEGMQTPTYHTIFLPKNRTAHQIDHLLIWTRLESLIITSSLLFQYPFPWHNRKIYVSDHMGLSVKVKSAE